MQRRHHENRRSPPHWQTASGPRTHRTRTRPPPASTTRGQPRPEDPGPSPPPRSSRAGSETGLVSGWRQCRGGARAGVPASGGRRHTLGLGHRSAFRPVRGNEPSHVASGQQRLVEVPDPAQLPRALGRRRLNRDVDRGPALPGGNGSCRQRMSSGSDRTTARARPEHGARPAGPRRSPGRTRGREECRAAPRQPGHPYSRRRLEPGPLTIRTLVAGSASCEEGRVEPVEQLRPQDRLRLVDGVAYDHVPTGLLPLSHPTAVERVLAPWPSDGCCTDSGGGVAGNKPWSAPSSAPRPRRAHPLCRWTGRSARPGGRRPGGRGGPGDRVPG